MVRKLFALRLYEPQTTIILYLSAGSQGIPWPGSLTMITVAFHNGGTSVSVTRN